MNEVKIEGHIENRFKIYWCDIDNKPFEVEAEYETPAEVLAHRYRLDWHYKIRVGGKYLTRKEFEKWARERG
jgi:hypothetical protein